MADAPDNFLIQPAPDARRLTRGVTGTDHNGNAVDLQVVEERPLTIFLNSQEIVTAMTIGDYPDYLAIGFLKNQGMLHDADIITSVDYDDDIDTVVVRTQTATNYEDKL
ncbi:MAG: formate dehydrogenase accessory sulfurtransferase FdhD, partial [Yoonia sp.]